MPFGIKKDQNGKTIHFDAVYEQLIKPAVEKANLNPIRADEEVWGGIIHKPMYERLMLCDYAIADLTTANANVFYELGIRHGIRPHSTVLLFAEGVRLPFDLAPMRGMPYKLDANGKPADIESSLNAIVSRLEECKDPSDDSPVYQLVSDMPRMDISRLKTDTFRDQVNYSNQVKDQLKQARGKDSNAVHAVREVLGDIENMDPAIIIDLMLSYRAVKDWPAMIELVSQMPALLGKTVMVQEQLGLAYNKNGQHEEAESVLLELINNYGPSSETNGLLGSVYKALWFASKKEGSILKSNGFLKKAIDCYLAGFETDWRDAYPGINAVTLMELQDTVDERQAKLLPLVHYAAERRLASGEADYWDHATLVEVAVLSNNKDAAAEALSDALVSVREIWEPESTANNLQMIIDARKERGEDVAWVEEIREELLNAAH